MWIKKYNFVNSRFIHKQSIKGVYIKRCSKNIKQIYGRTPMREWGCNKVSLQLYWNCTSARVFSWKFAVYFWNIFIRKHVKHCSSATCKKYWIIDLGYACACQLSRNVKYCFPKDLEKTVKMFAKDSLFWSYLL